MSTRHDRDERRRAEHSERWGLRLFTTGQMKRAIQQELRDALTDLMDDCTQDEALTIIQSELERKGFAGFTHLKR